jgi:hypothetical protein
VLRFAEGIVLGDRSETGGRTLFLAVQRAPGVSTKIRVAAIESTSRDLLAEMSLDQNTSLLIRACQLRWPSRSAAGLAALLRCPKSTAASWLSGRRHPRAETMELLAGVLCEEGQILIDIAGELASAAKLKGAQPRRPRGFQVVKDWDGSGIMRDARWRGGRPRKNSDFSKIYR